METPIEQILEGFEGLTLTHFIPIFVMAALILLIGAHRSRTSGRKTSKNDMKSAIRSNGALKNAANIDNPRMEDVLEAIRADIASKT